MEEEGKEGGEKTRNEGAKEREKKQSVGYINNRILPLYSTASMRTQTGHTQPHTFPGLQGGGPGLPSGPPLWTA